MRKIILALLLSLWSLPAAADSIPTGFQEYIVAGHDDQVYRMLDAIRVAEGGSLFSNPRGMNSVISLTATTNAQTVVYDHWEDGYEDDILNPTQASTMILGDGNPSNGNAADFGGLEGDLIDVRSALVFESSSSTAQPGTINDFVPFPRSAQPQLRFDAPDRLLSSGGPVTVVHAMEPRNRFIGGAFEIYPKQILASTTKYRIPIGTDLYVAPGSGDAYDPFKYVFLQVVAYEDGTEIVVDNGVEAPKTITLDRGDSWSSQGRKNFTSTPSTAVQVRAGTTVEASGPVTAAIFTGSDGRYQTRFFVLLPEQFYSNDYIVPVYGDGPSNGDKEQNLYLYNPNDFSINVTAYDSQLPAGGTLTIPPQGTRAYSQPVAQGGLGKFVPAGSTVRLVSANAFWGISAIDYTQVVSDWGFGFVPRRLLPSEYTVSWAPGTSRVPPEAGDNRSPVWISPVFDGTLVSVDLNNDGVFDQVDVNGDDIVDAFTAPAGVRGYVVQALSALRIYDPDFDNTGIHVVASGPIAGAYGQDSERGTPPDFSYDLGYSFLPKGLLSLEPILSVDVTADSEFIPPAGGDVQFTIALRSFDLSPVTGVDAFHQLPTGFSYVAGSTTVTLPNGTTSTTDPSTSSVPAGTLLNWGLGASLSANEEILVTFTARMGAGEADGRYTHAVEGLGSFQGRSWRPTDSQVIVKTFLTSSLVASAPTVTAGGQVSFAGTVENVSATQDATNVISRIAVPQNATFVSSTVGVLVPACSCVEAIIPLLAPGATFSFDATFGVDAAAVGGDIVDGEARVRSVEAPELLSNAQVTVVDGVGLTATMTAPNIAISPSTFSYRATVANEGFSNASATTVSIAIPALTTYVGDSLEISIDGEVPRPLTDLPADDEGEFNIAGDAVLIQLSSLAAGSSVDVSFRVDVDSGLAVDTEISATAVAEAVPFPPVTSAPAITLIVEADDDLDNDGLSNDDETDVHGTDPLDADTDDDGLGDGDEVLVYGSSPLLPDSDGDYILDGTEAGVTSPGPDTNLGAGNFRPDSDAGQTTTDPADADTDLGGDRDGTEDHNKNGRIDPGETDPNDANDDDPDRDGLQNGDEMIVGTDPRNRDTDEDLLWDGQEVGPDINNPLNTDGDEFINALDPDDDNDTILTADEVTDGNAFGNDVDGDQVPNWHDDDSDGDDYSDEDEAGDDDLETPPVNTSGDGRPDYLEPNNTPADRFIIVGGGCACNSAGSTSSLLGFLMMLPLFLVFRRRRTTVANGSSRSQSGTIVALVIFGLAAAASPSFAQGNGSRDFSVERLVPPLQTGGAIHLEPGTLLAPWSWELGMWTSYANDVLNVEDPDSNARVGELLKHRVTTSFTGSIGLRPWFQLGVELPLVLYQAEGDTSQLSVSAVDVAGLGDIRLGPKVRLLRESRHGLNAALALDMTFPTSGSGDYLGEGAVAFYPRLSVSRMVAGSQLVGALGYRQRERVEMPELTIDDEISIGIGVSREVAKSLELALALQGGVAASAPFKRVNQSPLEGLASVRYAMFDNIYGMVGAGVGLSRGFGTPDFRTFLSVGMTMGRDASRTQPLADEEENAGDDAQPKDCDEALRRCEKRRRKLNDALAALANIADTTTKRIEAYRSFAEEVRRALGSDEVPMTVRNGFLVVKLSSDVLFDSGKAKLRNDGMSTLKRISAVLAAHPDRRYMIMGHTDDIPIGRKNAAFASNRELSALRASGVVRFLETSGVSAPQLAHGGFGEWLPEVANADDNGRRLNRRIEIIVSPRIDELPQYKSRLPVQDSGAEGSTENASNVVASGATCPQKLVSCNDAVMAAELALLRKREIEATSARRVAAFEDIASRLESGFDPGTLPITIRNGRMIITLSGDVLFDSGKTAIKPGAVETLTKISAILRKEGRRIIVAGHTDNVPIAKKNRALKSNRELSVKRAAAVLRVLETNGVDKELLSHLGYGEYLTDSDNETEVGRAANRRIELILLPRLSEVPLFPSEL